MLDEGTGPKAILPPKNPKIAPIPDAPRIPRLQSEIWSNSSEVKSILKIRNFSLLRNSTTDMIWNPSNPRQRMERKVVGTRTIGTGKWIKLVELEYSIGEDNENNSKWESVERITKSNSSEIDCTN